MESSVPRIKTEIHIRLHIDNYVCKAAGRKTCTKNSAAVGLTAGGDH